MDELMHENLHRPQRRHSVTYLVYVDLVCRLRTGTRRKEAIRQSVQYVKDAFSIERRQRCIVLDVYDRFIRKSLRNGCMLKDIW